MAKFELKLPKMGESVAEATLTAWLKDVGDKIDADEPVLEIATDKVDSEVPSEVEGVLVQKLFEIDDVIEVGQTIAIIETESDTQEITVPAATVAEVSDPKEVVQLETSISKVKDEMKSVQSNETRSFSANCADIVRRVQQTGGRENAKMGA